jgi:hypothetical protein
MTLLKAHILSQRQIKNKAIATFGLGFAQTDLSKELKAHSLMVLLKAHILSQRPVRTKPL